MLYAKGRSAVFIAEKRQTSPHAVRSHMARIYNKCAVHSRQEMLSLTEDNHREDSCTPVRCDEKTLP